MHFPVDLHTHTIASTHAYSTLQEYIPVAKERGIKLFATTDHGPRMDDAPHQWHFINMVVLPRFIEGIGILRGMEANVLNVQGEIDCDERMQGSLDIILAGFHKPTLHPTSKREHTEMMINCIKSGRVDIITHPGNPRFPIDARAVAEVAKACNVALEINNSSFLTSRIGSYDNCLEIAKAVRDVGGVISLGTDSHHASHMGNFEQCINLLEAADFPQERIINRSPRFLLDYLESRGHQPIAEFKQL